MTKKMTPREWETISAYLDGQLALNDRKRLESQLRINPELRQAMEEMRRTRLLIRSQPKLRAPRNFTLTPQMVARSRRVGKRPWWYDLQSLVAPAFSAAAAMAGILLILVLIGDWMTARPAASTLVAQAPAETMMMEAPEAEALPQAASEAPMAKELPAQAITETTVLSESATLTDQAAPEMSAFSAPAEPTLTEEEALAATNAPPGMGGGAVGAASQPPYTSEATQPETEAPAPQARMVGPEPTVESEAAAPMLAQEAPAEALPTESAALLAEAQDRLDSQPQAEQPPASIFGLRVWVVRTLEIVLALAAITTAIIAFLMRKR